MQTSFMMRRLLAGLALSALLTAPVKDAAGQSAVVRTVRVEVGDSSGRPVGDARITVRETAAIVRSDSNGVALLRDLPRSPLHLSVKRLGFDSVEVDLSASSEKLRLTLQVHAEPIAGLERREPASVPGGFAERRAHRSGIFITPQQIARSHASAPSDLLQRLSFVSLVAVGSGHGVRFAPDAPMGSAARYSYGRPTEPCIPMILLDGKPAPALELDDLHMDEILAIEVYRSQATIPPPFIAGGTAECGAIVVWMTRTK
jgi:hypothetical protein